MIPIDFCASSINFGTELGLRFLVEFSILSKLLWINISLTEVIASAITHWNWCDPSLWIIINFKYHDNKLVIRLEDCWIGFDYWNIINRSSGILDKWWRWIKLFLTQLTDGYFFIGRWNIVQLQFINDKKHG